MGNHASEKTPSPSSDVYGTVRPKLGLVGKAVAKPRTRRLDAAAKRAFDVVVSAVALVLLSPVFVACAIAVKFESPGPVFYRARRVGREGCDLDVLKFRKMRDGVRGVALTGDRDARFTRIGRFLARTKLDELPQLWTVLVGGMSIVGPRPEDAGFVELHRESYSIVLSVRPGVTGLSQLAFAKEAQILDPDDRIGHYIDRILPQKVALDSLYAETRTFGLDLRIILWTVLPVVMRRDVAVNRATGVMTIRLRERASVAGSGENDADSSSGG